MVKDMLAPMGICEVTGESTNIFCNNDVTDAWQDGEYNNYEYDCPHCGNKHVLKVFIEDAIFETKFITGIVSFIRVMRAVMIP